jgi:hypothetical protein
MKSSSFHAFSVFCISLFLFLNLMLATIHYERQSSLKKKTNYWLLCILRANIVYRVLSSLTYMSCKTYIRIYAVNWELGAPNKLDVFNANQTVTPFIFSVKLLTRDSICALIAIRIESVIESQTVVSVANIQ